MIAAIATSNKQHAMKLEDPRIAIIGHGYVGLRLTKELDREDPVTGFEIQAKQTLDLNKFVGEARGTLFLQPPRQTVGDRL